MFKKSAFILLSFFLISPAWAAQKPAPEEAQQQISDFSLAGYGERGKKTWDLTGKSADILTDTINLKDIVGNMYGEEDVVKLTADKGDFNRSEGKMHVEQNVVITTASGSKLTTDYLEWDRKNNIIATHALVNVERENMTTTAQGAMGFPGLNRMNFEKDVTVKFNPDTKGGATENDRIVITCDGPLEIDYAKNIATFKNNVKVQTQGNIIYSDAMDVYFITGKGGNKEEAASQAPGSAPMDSKIDKIVARGNVKIVRGENVSYSEEATYIAQDKRIVLTGRPKLIIFSTEGMNASFRN